MAVTTTQRSVLSALQPQAPNVDAICLRRLLVRLEQQLLVPGPDSEIFSSSIERSKLSQNIEAARTYLLRLEHNTPSIKIQSRKHAQQAELARHRALLKRLTERLHELNRQDDAPLDLNADAGEDILSEYFAPEPAKLNPSKPNMTSSATTIAGDGLRSRTTQSGTATATPSLNKGPTTALADELFRHKSSSTKSGLAPADMSMEKQLEHQDSTQADLTSSLVQMAERLKLGSLEFQQSLTEDEEIRNRTEQSITKSSSSMEIASRSMGTLRRMSEGRWWWQRYIMFILIFLLWFVLLGLVFLSPKLRF